MEKTEQAVVIVVTRGDCMDRTSLCSGQSSRCGPGQGKKRRPRKTRGRW